MEKEKAIEPGSIRSDTPDWYEGYENGMKKAWELVGELAVFYRDNIDCGDDWPVDEKVAFKKELQAQVNACRYAQHVIKSGTFDEKDELPW